jgi:hypothetical protein
LIPTSATNLGGHLLLLSIIAFPASSDEGAKLFNFIHSDDQLEAPDRSDFVRILGLKETRHNDFTFDRKDTTDDVLLLSLYLLRNYLSTMISGGLAAMEKVALQWPGDDIVQRKLLIDLLITADVSVRLCPPSEPLLLPFKTLIEAIESTGLSVPRWCLDIVADKRQSLLDALSEVTKTVVLVLTLSENPNLLQLNYKRKPDDRQVLLMAERNASFCAVFRVRVVFDNHVSLSILSNQGSIRNLRFNKTPLALEKQEHSVEITANNVIEFIVDDTQVRFKFSNA